MQWILASLQIVEIVAWLTKASIGAGTPHRPFLSVVPIAALPAFAMVGMVNTTEMETKTIS